ncbi:hypothetical protein [Streptomyces sp. NPDC005012]|uniref:hypothetical protein n=1 Tax=Streptomyces sp. NPDC005012 TaxID=3154558 RepID=UPI0033AB061E
MNALSGGLAANPSLPSRLVDRLIATADEELALELAYRSDLTERQAAALVARYPGTGVPLARAGRLTPGQVDPAELPDTAPALLDEGAGPPEWARLFTQGADTGRRVRLAACPGLPPDVVAALADDHEVEVVAELALSAPAEVAVRLAGHPHAEVRCAVAGNENTPPESLVALLTGEGLEPARHCLVCDTVPVPFVHDPGCPSPDCDLPPGADCDGGHASTLLATRDRALRNPTVPGEVVVRFAADPVFWIRELVAAHPRLPADAGTPLAADPSPAVRGALARNPVIGTDLMRTLSADADPAVRRELAHNPRLPLDLLAELTGRFRSGIGPLPRVASASPAEVARLAASPHAGLRALVAARDDLPAATRDALAADPDAQVAKNVAPHPGLDEALLRRMLERHGERVAARVAANPGATPLLLAELTRLLPGARKALRVVARHPAAPAGALEACLDDRQARPLAAGHPRLPVPRILALLDDGDERVVEAAAANPSLPVQEMERLVP